MANWYVIADDLSGAAEIAGIAWHSGCTVKLLTGESGDGHTGEDVLVVNADTRNLDPEDAAGHISDVFLYHGYQEDRKLFLKTDSLLRGNVGPEILAALSATSFSSCLLVPANPSKQRIIRDSNYYINNTLLAETEYRNDPEYPRTTSDVAEMVAVGPERIDTAEIDWNHCQGKIMVPDVCDAGDIRALVSTHITCDMMPAGGVDFFRELLIETGSTEAGVTPPGVEYPSEKCFVFGSYADANRKALVALARKRYSIYDIPLSVGHGDSSKGDDAPVVPLHLVTGNKIVLKLQDRYIDNAKIREAMLEELVEIATDIAVTAKGAIHFLVTGGRTASLFCRKLHWNQLSVMDAPGNGTTTLKYKDVEHLITIKPGSYDWPDFMLK